MSDTNSATELAVTTNQMSKEDIAFFVRNIWDALIAPPWKRDDLIELGKAVFAKVPLAKLDDKIFERLLPFLGKIAEILGGRIQARIMEEQIRLLESSTQGSSTQESSTQGSSTQGSSTQGSSTPAAAPPPPAALKPIPPPTPAKPQSVPVPPQTPAQTLPLPNPTVTVKPQPVQLPAKTTTVPPTVAPPTQETANPLPAPTTQPTETKTTVDPKAPPSELDNG